MIYAVYIIALALAFLAYAMTFNIDGTEPIDPPPTSALTNFATRMAIVCMVVLTVFGFWKLPWYLPLLAWLIVAITSGVLVVIVRRSFKASSFLVGFSAASAILTMIMPSLIE